MIFVEDYVKDMQFTGYIVLFAQFLHFSLPLPHLGHLVIVL